MTDCFLSHDVAWKEHSVSVPNDLQPIPFLWKAEPSINGYRITVMLSLTMLILLICHVLFVCFWHNIPPVGQGPLSSFTRFLDHTQTRHSRYDSSGWVISLLQRPLPDNRQTSMPLVGFEPTISACERLQTQALDRATTETGHLPCRIQKIYFWSI
jgi:hypothetical protein